MTTQPIPMSYDYITAVSPEDKDKLRDMVQRISRLVTHAVENPRLKDYDLGKIGLLAEQANALLLDDVLARKPQPNAAEPTQMLEPDRTPNAHGPTV